MSFSITIQPNQTKGAYGVNSSHGYQIHSASLIGLEETEKIQKVLGSFVELAIAEDNMTTREEKFQKYVAWKPREEWEKTAEYQLYKSALATLNKAQEHFSNIKMQYQVTAITPF
jgi:hypothetical protein